MTIVDLCSGIATRRSESELAREREGRMELYQIPTIRYVRLQITLEAQKSAVLPPFKGSMLRGAFGHALRRTVCAVGPEQPCASCRLRQACIYTRIFETFVECTPPPFLRGVDTAPRPFVIEPGDNTRDFAPGDPLAFDILLFGQAAELQAYVLLAVERMAAGGLGYRRAPFILHHARALAPDGTWQTLFEDGRAHGPAALLPCHPPQASLDAKRATLHLLTPLRIFHRGRLATTFDFRVLAFHMLRRALEIAQFHMPGADIDWDFRSLLDRADDIRVTTAHLDWHDWERYSSRQQTRMALGGLVGTLEIEGDLAPFLPLLCTAEILHVGKNATFGLGKLQAQILA